MKTELTKFTRHLSLSPDASEREEIRRARALVEERFRDASLGLAEVAGRAGLSAAHFSHTFRQVTGRTLTGHIQARRVAEAKRLLDGTDRSITDICFDCGFNSLTHFNRVFRSIERCSPRQQEEKGTVHFTSDFSSEERLRQKGKVPSR